MHTVNLKPIDIRDMYQTIEKGLGEDFSFADFQKEYSSYRNRETKKSICYKRLHSLTEKGYIKKYAPGRYKKIKVIRETTIKNEVPSKEYKAAEKVLSSVCKSKEWFIWELKQIAALFPVPPQKNIVFVYVEKEDKDKAYRELSRKMSPVIKGQTERLIEQYLEIDNIVVLENLKGRPKKREHTGSPERIVVEMFSSKLLLEIFSIKQLSQTAKAISNRYELSEQKLKSYARYRNKLTSNNINSLMET